MSKVIGNTTTTPISKPYIEQIIDHKLVPYAPLSFVGKEIDNRLTGYSTTEDVNGLVNPISEKVGAIVKELDTVDSIAKGANQAISFKNYEEFIEHFNYNMGNPEFGGLSYNIGQNIMIETLEVPDLWISKRVEDYQPYEYTTDEAFVGELKTNGSVCIGWYVFSQLETQKVDLTDYPTTEEMNTAINDAVSNIPTGTTNEYELIKTITITEDIPTVDENGTKIPITFNLDDNGNTFKLDGFVIAIDCPEISTHDGYWRADANSYPNAIFYEKPTGKRFKIRSERLTNGYWWSQGVHKFVDSYSSSGGYLASKYIIDKADYITSFYFEIPRAPIGTTIMIYGRRVSE